VVFVDARDAMLTLTKDTLDNIQLKQITIDQAVALDALHIDGKKEAFTDFLGLLDTYPFWFNIVTP
jgi:linear primary-alkylsulfatase